MATVKHIQVNTLPDVLEPGAIYFVRSTGQIVQTDLNGVPVEYGGIGGGFYAIELSGELRLARGNIPSGHSRDHYYENNAYRIIKWTWGDFDRLVNNASNALTYYKGWYIPRGYKFKRLKLEGGYTSKAIPNWTIYLIRKRISTAEGIKKGNAVGTYDGVIATFPIDMQCNAKDTLYWGWSAYYDISDRNIVTGDNDMYAVMMLSDNIDNTDPDQMYVKNFLLRFELKKV